jgi:hypothetical protein
LLYFPLSFYSNKNSKRDNAQAPQNRYKYHNLSTRYQMQHAKHRNLEIKPELSPLKRHLLQSEPGKHETAKIRFHINEKNKPNNKTIN